MRGARNVRILVSYYMANATKVREGLSQAGLECHGGTHAPYVWVRCPEGVDSWGMFDRMLSRAHVVVTPGAGFGKSGEGFFRVSAFGDSAKVEEAMGRIVAAL